MQKPPCGRAHRSTVGLEDVDDETLETAVTVFDRADSARTSAGSTGAVGWRPERRASVYLGPVAYPRRSSSVSPASSSSLKFCRSSTAKLLEIQAAADDSRRHSSGGAATRASRSARQELGELADAPLPSRRGVLAPTIYLAVSVLRVPLQLTGLTRLCSPFYAALVRLGGVERLYVLLTIARFDPDNFGNIDERKRQAKGREMVQDAAATCSSMSVVSSLMIGLSHLQAIGRPDVWEASPESLEYYGEEAAEELLWAVHAVNALTEGLYAPGASPRTQRRHGERRPCH